MSGAAYEQKAQKKYWSEKDLKNIVILEPLCEGDLLGDRKCVGEIFIWKFVHLHHVICSYCCVCQDRLEPCFNGGITFGDDEGMAFGEWANVKKGEPDTTQFCFERRSQHIR